MMFCKFVTYLLTENKMNDLETEMHRVVDAVLSACVTTITTTGKPSLTKNDLLGNSRRENAVMARTILAAELLRDGFSVTTIGQLLSRTERQVRQMASAHDAFKTTSHAYRIAVAEIKRNLNGDNSETT